MRSESGKLHWLLTPPPIRTCLIKGLKMFEVKKFASSCCLFLLRLALAALALALMTLQIQDIHAQKDLRFAHVVLPHLIFFSVNAFLLDATLTKWKKSPADQVLIWALIYNFALVIDLILMVCLSLRHCAHSPATSDTVADFLTRQFKWLDSRDGHIFAAVGMACAVILVTLFIPALPKMQERNSSGPSEVPPCGPPPPYDPPRYADIVDA